jgi:hypothetical protein
MSALIATEASDVETFWTEVGAVVGEAIGDGAVVGLGMGEPDGVDVGSALAVAAGWDRSAVGELRPKGADRLEQPATSSVSIKMSVSVNRDLIWHLVAQRAVGRRSVERRAVTTPSIGSLLLRWGKLAE